MYYGQLLIRSQTKLLRLSGNQYDLFFLPTSEYWPDGFPFPLSLNSCVICLAEENIPQHEEAILFKLLYHLFHKVVNVHPVVVHTARPENEDLYQRDEVHPSCGHYFFLYCLPSGPLSRHFSHTQGIFVSCFQGKKVFDVWEDVQKRLHILPLKRIHFSKHVNPDDLSEYNSVFNIFECMSSLLFIGHLLLPLTCFMGKCLFLTPRDCPVTLIAGNCRPGCEQALLIVEPIPLTLTVLPGRARVPPPVLTCGSGRE